MAISEDASNKVVNRDLVESSNGSGRNARSQRTDEPNKTSSSAATTGHAKYRHVAAVHARSRTSCLSSDSEKRPSFLGFRNLMVIVLSKPSILYLIYLGTLACRPLSFSIC